MKIANDTLADTAMAATVTTDALDCSHIGMLSIMAKNSGVATNGVLRLQGANSVKSPVNGDFADISGAVANITAVGAYPVQLEYVTFKWIRAVYTQSAGTGTLTITYMGKGF